MNFSGWWLATRHIQWSSRTVGPSRNDVVGFTEPVRALVARVYFLQGKDNCIVFFGPRYLLFISPGHTTRSGSLACPPFLGRSRA
jgi:hypothetical protein